MAKLTFFVPIHVHAAANRPYLALSPRQALEAPHGWPRSLMVPFRSEWFLSVQNRVSGQSPAAR
jgi:hypothetical protein